MIIQPMLTVAHISACTHKSVQLANLEKANITRETAKCNSEKAKQEMERSRAMKITQTLGSLMKSSSCAQ